MSSVPRRDGPRHAGSKRTGGDGGSDEFGHREGDAKPNDADQGTDRLEQVKKDPLPGLVGWLLTAIAASFGAPFWFDMLNKIMVVHSTAKPHQKSPEEASEDPQGRTGDLSNDMLRDLGATLSRLALSASSPPTAIDASEVMDGCGREDLDRDGHADWTTV